MDYKIHNCSDCQLRSNCFNKLNINELELVSAKKVELKYRKGENIAKQGSFVHHILFLQKGLVKVYMELQEKQDLILNIFGNSQLIGLPNLFTNNPLQYSVAAIDDSIVCAIDIRIFEEMITSNGFFAKSIIEDINHCTRYYFQRILSTSQKQLSGRMADALLHFSEKIYKSDMFPMLLTRKELAEFAGMSNMSAVRVIKDFESSGLITEKSGKISIKDKDKLLQISRSG